MQHYIFQKCKKYFIKMLKDVGINLPSGAQWTTDYDITIHNLCMQEMMKTHVEIMHARQWQTNNIVQR